MSMRDLPAIGTEAPPNLRVKLEAQREVLQTLLGYRGDPLDRALTYRDITPLPDGSVVISPGGGGGTGGGTTVVINPPGTGEEPDLTPPPTPTGLAVQAGLGALFIAWDVAAYTVGHGPGRTNIYGVPWALDDPTPPTFSDAVLLSEAAHALTLYAHPSEPGVRWCIWIKFQTADGVESATPAGGANGVQATVGQDPAKLLELLSGQITESQLYAALGARIDLIDGPTSLPGSVAARVETVQATATSAQNLASANAQQITTVQAQVNEAAGMAPLRTWSFAVDAEGWLASGATLSYDAGTLVWAPTASNPLLAKTFTVDERFAGGANTIVRAKVRRLTGTGAWEGVCFHRTAGHNFSTTFRKAIAAPANPNAWNVLEWDMAALDAGGTDWVDNDIYGLRFDLVSDGGTSTWAIEWIAVGARSITPLMAAVQEETTARAAADGYLGAQWTLRMSVGNIIGGIGLSGTSAPDAQPTIDFGVRANKFFIAPPEGVAGVGNILPFVVQTTDQVLPNGTTVPKGVYMDAAFIKNLDAVAARFGNATISGTAIANNLSASQLTVGTGVVGGNLRSTNFVSGSTGWLLQPNGYAEFSNIVIRGATYTGTIFAGSGTIGGISILADRLQSSNYVPNVSGFRITTDGEIFANNVALRGALNGGAFTGFAWPTSGTGFHLGPSGLLLGNGNTGPGYFRVNANGDVAAPGFSITAGNLTINGNGTFGGALNAATGTFAGVLTAAAVNAIDTINIRGQAVTVTAAAEITDEAGIALGTGYTTLCSVSLNTGNMPIMAFATVIINPAVSPTVRVRILIGGAVEREVSIPAGGDYVTPTLIALRAAPGSGSVTVTLQASASSGAGRAHVGTALAALGCKR